MTLLASGLSLVLAGIGAVLIALGIAGLYWKEVRTMAELLLVLGVFVVAVAVMLPPQQ